jgi:hypothetical protein
MTDTFVMSVVNGLPSGTVINSPLNSKHHGRTRGAFACSTGSVTPQGKRVGIGNHRKMYFKPIWERDGYSCQEEYDLVRWGISLCVYYVTETNHPRYKRAKAALEWNKKQK